MIYQMNLRNKFDQYSAKLIEIREKLSEDVFFSNKVPLFLNQGYVSRFICLSFFSIKYGWNNYFHK